MGKKRNREEGEVASDSADGDSHPSSNASPKKKGDRKREREHSSSNNNNDDDDGIALNDSQRFRVTDSDGMTIVMSRKAMKELHKQRKAAKQAFSSLNTPPEQPSKPQQQPQATPPSKQQQQITNGAIRLTPNPKIPMQVPAMPMQMPMMPMQMPMMPMPMPMMPIYMQPNAGGFPTMLPMSPMAFAHAAATGLNPVLAGMPADAKPAVTVTARGDPKTLRDIQILPMYLLTEGIAPNWCMVTHGQLIKKTCVLAVPGISPTLLGSQFHLFEETQKRFGSALVTVAPGTKTRIYATLHAFLNTFKQQQDKKQQKAAALEAQAAATAAAAAATTTTTTDATDAAATQQQQSQPPPPPQQQQQQLPGIEHYVASLAVLDENSYPIAGRSATAKYLSTRKLDRPADAPARVFALDCEMVNTGIKEMALARFTLVEGDTIVLDEFVKPEKHVTDYNTRYSGITREHLENVTMTLEQARELFLNTVSADDILIGHSLENDLHALQVIHYRVVDTSLIFPHPRGPPFKSALRFLTKQYLGTEIQKETHDSAEDARAAEKLVRLKISKGPEFGEPKSETETIFTAFARHAVRSTTIDVAGINRVYTNTNPDLPQPPNMLNKGIEVAPDEEMDRIVDLTLNELNTGDSTFVWARCTRIESALEAESPTDDAEFNAMLESNLAKINDGIAKLYDNAPANTLILVISLNGDLAEYKRMVRTDEGNPALIDLVNEAKMGIAWIAVKNNT